MSIAQDLAAYLDTVNKTSKAGKSKLKRPIAEISAIRGMHGLRTLSCSGSLEPALL